MNDEVLSKITTRVEYKNDHVYGYDIKDKLLFIMPEYSYKARITINKVFKELEERSKILCWEYASGSFGEMVVTKDIYLQLGLQSTFEFWEMLGITNLRLEHMQKVDVNNYKIVTTTWLVGDAVLLEPEVLGE